MTKTEKEIKLITENTINSLGYKLYDIMFLKEAGSWYLRFFIQREDGQKIDLDDCEKVSTAIEPILDEKDPIEEAYNLEVSSCGLEPHLREESHFLEAIGKKIHINLFKPIDGTKEYEGVLTKYSPDILELSLSNNELKTFENKDIASAKISYNWEELENE